MTKRSIILLILMALFLSACSAAKTVAPEAGFDMAQSSPPMVAEEMAAAREAGSGVFDSGVNAVERLVIRNANLTIVVRDPAATLEDVMRMADQMGGFVVDSSLYQRQTATGAQVQEARVTIRVPAARLDDAMTQIKSHVDNLATDVLTENVTGQDVTKEYTDLQSRLRNLEDAAEQLRKIMDTATKPEDVLQIFNELKNVNEQIEIIKGQIQYYEESAAMSAISTYIQAQESVAPLSVGGWRPQGVARDALQALISAFQWIANAVIWIVLFCLPIALPIAVVVFFIIKGVRKMRANRKQKSAVVEVKDKSE